MSLRPPPEGIAETDAGKNLDRHLPCRSPTIVDSDGSAPALRGDLLLQPRVMLCQDAAGKEEGGCGRPGRGGRSREAANRSGSYHAFQHNDPALDMKTRKSVCRAVARSALERRWARWNRKTDKPVQ